MKTCSTSGCIKPTRTKSAELCKMHYHRQYRGRPIGDATELKRKSRSPECHIEGCLKPDTEGGFCSMHGARMRRHGDPEIVVAPEDRNMRTGPAHPLWAGQDVSYGAAHDRVKRRRGSAAQYRCVDCENGAQHWSYNHDDPEEIVGHARSANAVAYSTKPDHYSPRCVPCHKRFDLDKLNAASIV